MNTSSVVSSSSSDVATAGRNSMGALALAALGVVYGDIGTSPLYTIKEVFAPATGVPLDELHIIGAVSTIFWALMLVVTLKYVYLVLRADNHGEGGVLALTALASQVLDSRPRVRRLVLGLGLFGATLFYGDSVITPAISVLGAMEGLEVVTPSLEPLILPIALGILISLFGLQRFGTGRVGKMFGPVILAWFLMLAASGLTHIIETPAILAALNPLLAWEFLAERGPLVFAAVGAIVLALTGAEALYADMGHFGRRPIQLAWTFLVLPALALNYAGQGALLLSNPAAITNPFYLLFPPALLWPALVLASMAAIIASQAVISGAYSMTRQAMQLGFLPRMAVHHTSAQEAGQIYMPSVNWTLLAAVIATVLLFGSSSRLAGAYGVAVTLTMLITTIMTLFVILGRFRIPAPIAYAATGFFLVVDILLVVGCSIKFFEGGWFPLLMGLMLFAAMSTWQRGRSTLIECSKRDGMSLGTFLQTLRQEEYRCAKRVAVYMVTDPTTVPPALLHNLKHYQTLHETNVILTTRFAEVPFVPASQRLELEELGKGFWKITLTFGFMETPDVPGALQSSEAHGLKIPLFHTSFFLSRETLVVSRGTHMARWRQAIFAAMSRNAGNVVEFFRLPDNAVVELGARVRI